MSASGDTQVESLGTLRLERLYSPRERRQELESKIKHLLEIAENDLKRLRSVTTSGSEITLHIPDEDVLSAVIAHRAFELKPFFEGYTMMAHLYDQVQFMQMDDAVSCVELAYRYKLVPLTEETDALKTILLAWRGMLELS